MPGQAGAGVAEYDQKINRITFKKVDKPDFLKLVLIHELKHAEQCDKESYLKTKKAYDAAMAMAFGNSNPMENAYAWHQLQFCPRHKHMKQVHELIMRCLDVQMMQIILLKYMRK